MSLPRDHDTRIGGPARSFPPTRHTAVIAAQSADPAERVAAHDALARAYWKPCYAYARLRWRLASEDAKDLVQGFFAQAFEQGLFARYDAGQGRFRSFLRGCLEKHALKQRESAQRLARGGGERHGALDEAVELSDSAAEEARESVFQREWCRHVLELAIDVLRARCAELGKTAAFAAFERYDLHDPARGERPSYAELARELGTSETAITNQLHWARSTLREIALAELASAAGGEDEWRADVRALFGEGAP